MTEIKKKYNHFVVESEFLKNNYFQKLMGNTKNSAPKEILTTQLPITITKDLSLDTIRPLIIEDSVSTYYRMKGKKAHMVPIFDNEEKQIKKNTYENILYKTGIFCGIDSDNIIYSERNTNFVRNMFGEMIQQGDIYRDSCINYRNVNKQRTVNTNELQYKHGTIKQYAIRYFVDTKNISLVVPTTSPETIFADVALAVHPDDKRYKKITKSKVIIPIINQAIPIITDESVDSTKGNGIIRITPAHDQNSLIIAQKHGLRTDKFAIEKNGCFSKNAWDFAGKPVHDFIKNIIKNLDDIHNLESTKIIEGESILEKNSGEKVYPILSKQLFIKTREETTILAQDIVNKQITIIPEHYQQQITNTATFMEYRPVTKDDTRGYYLPLRTNKSGAQYVINDNTFLNIPSKKIGNKGIVMSLIIFNLIADNRLPIHFSIEECIDAILEKSRTGETNTLEAYIGIFTETLPRGYGKEIHEIQKLIEYTEKEKWISNFEKFSVSLSDMLEKSVCIHSKRKWFYYLDIDELVNDEGVLHQQQRIDETLGHALIMQSIMQAFDEGKTSPQKHIHMTENQINDLIKINSIGHHLTGKRIWDTWYIDTNISNVEIHKKNSHKTNIKDYGTDTTRLYALAPEKDIIEYEQFIHKLRNAARFIMQGNLTKKWTPKTVNFEELWTYLTKKQSNLNEFEIWILYQLQEFQKEYEENIQKYEIRENITKIIHLIKDEFCDKYLEIQKHTESEYQQQVTIRCLGNLIQLLHPFAPFITQKIREMIGFEWPIIKTHIQEKSIPITKNYKTQLFMDIINKFLEMKQQYNCAKHENVDICFFAPLDFLQYLRAQEQIMNNLIHIECITYLESEKELQWYHTEHIINITIGIKKNINTPTTCNRQQQLKDLLQIKEQALQTIRTMLPWLSASGADPEIITNKKKEMIQLKKDIENLEYEIQKQKFNK